MTPGTHATRSLATVLSLALLFVATAASPARADITAFLGLTPTPERHLLKGFSGGVGMIIVGFEFEYAHTAEDDVDLLPGLQTFSGNVLVQTPTRTQLYATAGGTGYRETLGDTQETHVATNIGGGVKIPLVGPLRLRLDYRVFKLQGTPLHSVYQRFYVGGNLKF
jgi:hypothetical protein